MKEISDLRYIVGLGLYFVFAVMVVMGALAAVFPEERWWLSWIKKRKRQDSNLRDFRPPG